MKVLPNKLQVFSSPNRLSHHRINHFEKYECDICGVIIRTKGSLKRHMKLHMITSSVKFCCADCGISFHTNPRFQQHRMRAHGAHSDIQCAVCGLKFFYPSALKNHNLIIHKRVNPYPISANAMSEMPFSCDICHKMFKFQSFMIKHKKMHLVDPVTGVAQKQIKSYCCSICPKKFRFKLV